MFICTWVDPYASWDSTPEEEYDELEEKLLKLFEKHLITIKRNVPIHRFETCDLYVIDYGGAAAQNSFSDYSSVMFGRPLIKLIQENPNTVFAINSTIASRHLVSDFMDEIGTDEFDSSRLPPNVIINDEWDDTKFFSKVFQAVVGVG